MNVTGIKGPEDFPFAIPEGLAIAITELIDAMERDDINLDCYFDEVDGNSRMVVGEKEDTIRQYYLHGGYRADIVD